MGTLRDILSQLVRVAARQRPDETMEALLVAEKAIEGITPTGVLIARGELSAEELEELKQRWAAVADRPKWTPVWEHDIDAGGNCRAPGCQWFSDGDRRHNGPSGMLGQTEGSIWD